MTGSVDGGETPGQEPLTARLRSRHQDRAVEIVQGLDFCASLGQRKQVVGVRSVVRGQHAGDHGAIGVGRVGEQVDMLHVAAFALAPGIGVVGRPVCIQADQCVGVGVGRIHVQREGTPANEDLAVGLDRQRVHHAGGGIQRVVEPICDDRAVGIDAGDAVAAVARSIHVRQEAATHQDPAIPQRHHGPNLAAQVGQLARVPRRPERAISRLAVQPRDRWKRLPADRIELAADDDLAIGLVGHGTKDRPPFHPAAQIEGRIQGTLLRPTERRGEQSEEHQPLAKPMRLPLTCHHRLCLAKAAA